MSNFIVSNFSDKLIKSVTLEIGSKAKNMIANGIKVIEIGRASCRERV